MLNNNSGLLVNEIGFYEGGGTQRFDPGGICMFNVEADGDWTIEVREYNNYSKRRHQQVCGVVFLSN